MSLPHDKLLLNNWVGRKKKGRERGTERNGCNLGCTQYYFSFPCSSDYKMSNGRLTRLLILNILDWKQIKEEMSFVYLRLVVMVWTNSVMQFRAN